MHRSLHRSTPALRRSVRLALLLAGSLAVLMGGCRGEPTDAESDVLAPEEFVETMVALREAEREAMAEDSVEEVFERRRNEILAERGVTPDDLREFVRRHRSDFTLMSRLWDTIAQRLKYLPGADEEAGSLPVNAPR